MTKGGLIILTRGCPDINLAMWPSQVFKNKLLNRMLELFPWFVVWEVWKEKNTQFFEEKNRTKEEVWQLIELHFKETLTLTQS